MSQNRTDGRDLRIESLYVDTAALRKRLVKPFVAMLPAYGSEATSDVEALVRVLVELGCLEICCVGPSAEALHDAIDWIVEEKEALEVVTTWHEDLFEGCSYFFLAQGAPSLVAFVEEQSLLTSILRAEVA